MKNIDFEAIAPLTSAMNGIADSTPSERRNAYKTNGKNIDFEASAPLASTMNGIADNENQNAYKTNGKAWILKQTHPWHQR